MNILLTTKKGTRIITDCTITTDGYVHKRKKPFFNVDIMNKNGLSVKDPIFKNITIEKALANERLKKCLMKFGENEGGKKMEDYDIIKRKKIENEETNIRNKKTPIEFGVSEFGLGLTLKTRLPKDVWNLIKNTANYESADEETMEFLDDQGYFGISKYDVKGWYYNEKSITILLDNGFTVIYRGYKIKSSASASSEMIKINAIINGEEKKHVKKIDEIRKKAADYKKKIWECKYVSDLELVKKIEKTPEINIFSFKGADIYGGGSWLHVMNGDLFYIKNNGMDGDAWGDNNYHTGGAGAICYKSKASPEILDEIKNWLAELGDYSIYAK